MLGALPNPALPLSILAPLLMAAILGACRTSPDGVFLSPADLEARGIPWPLSVDGGTVDCEQGRLAVFRTEDGRTFAVQGSAAALRRYPSIDELRRPDPDAPETRLALGFVLTEAVRQCGPESLTREPR